MGYPRSLALHIFFQQVILQQSQRVDLQSIPNEEIEFRQAAKLRIVGHSRRGLGLLVQQFHVLTVSLPIPSIESCIFLGHVLYYRSSQYDFWNSQSERHASR